MNKWILLFIFTLTSTLMSLTLADPFFGANNPPPASSANTTAMSAGDFKNLVTTMGQQAKSDLSNQWKQEIANTPPPMPQSQNFSNNQAGPNPGNNPSMSSMQPVNTINPPPAINSPRMQPPSNTAPVPSQNYSGFGPAPSSTPATTNSNSKGWNVNY